MNMKCKEHVANNPSQYLVHANGGSTSCDDCTASPPAWLSAGTGTGGANGGCFGFPGGGGVGNLCIASLHLSSGQSFDDDDADAIVRSLGAKDKPGNRKATDAYDMLL